MAITENHRQESLSRAYLAAVCASAGLIMKIGNFDYGIDVDIAEVKNRPKSSGKGQRFYESNQIRFQLKCTTNFEINNEKGLILYDLDTENFNDLCEVSTPVKLLGLFLLEKDVDSSIAYTQDELILKKCMYWQSFEGKEKTTNSSKIRVEIPQANLISPSSICSLFQFQFLKEKKI
jgi:Domain of unknown function (DUF4365)